MARRLLIGLMLLVLLSTGWVVYKANTYPPFERPQAAGSNPSTVQAVFMGTSTLLFSDGQTQWCLDCFVSRPAMSRVAFNTVEPDLERIKQVLDKAFDLIKAEKKLSGVLVAHSHYDHSMDAPAVIKAYGGDLIGSPSTLNIGLGQGLARQTLFDLVPGQSWQAGAFKVTGLKSAHAPTGFTGGFNKSPLPVPAHALRFKEGISYAYAVWHTGNPHKPVCLIQPSAGFVPGQFDGLESDTLFLGVGGLGKLDAQYMEKYWQETVIKPKAKRVYLIHWDDFTKPLLIGEQVNPLVPMPVLFDDYGKTLTNLIQLSKRDGVEVIIADALQRVPLF